MDGPRDYHIEWIKSDKEGEISGEPKKEWYKWTYLQNRIRLPDLENEFPEEWGRDDWEKG